MRQRGISLSKGVGSQLACSKPVSLGLFREAATNGCPSGEERTPRSLDRGVFHFRGGVAGIWGFGGVRTVVSHLSLGGPGRSGRLTDNTESRCLSLLVSPRSSSLVKSARPNEKPPGVCAEGLGSVARRASAAGRCVRMKSLRPCGGDRRRGPPHQEAQSLPGPEPRRR
jgi:hypothetical protein